MNTSTHAMTEAVADVLRQLTASARISQRQLAEQSGISQTKVSRVLNHKEIPDLAELLALAAVFDVTLEYLLNRANTLIAERASMKHENVVQLNRSEVPASVIERSAARRGKGKKNEDN